MKVTLVPSTVAGSGPEHFQFASSTVINGTVAIDAGCLGYFCSPEQQARVRHVLLTHSHADHIASLPIFVENAYEGNSECVTIHGTEEVLECCQRDLFNERIWPDFLALSARNDKPFLRMSRVVPGQTLTLEGLRIRAVNLNHVVPTVGYLVADDHSAAAFVSDTGPTEEVWELANATPNLKGVFLEATFPNEMEWLAAVSRHLTPLQVAHEVKKLKRPVRIIITHIKPRYQKQVIAELQGLGIPSLEIAQFGVPYTL